MRYVDDLPDGMTEEEYQAGWEDYERLNRRFSRGWTIVFVVALLWYGLVLAQPGVGAALNHLIFGA